jgi:uncharacterized protein DUF1761
MNIPRILLAGLGATFVYFAVGGITFTMPFMRNEYARFPMIYRSKESMMGVFPFGIGSMFVAMIVLAVVYARFFRDGGFADGAFFGALIGLFAVCSFVIHNYVNLNIGVKLTVLQAVAYFVEWVLVGVTIGLIYRPT